MSEREKKGGVDYDLTSKWREEYMLELISLLSMFDKNLGRTHFGIFERVLFLRLSIPKDTTNVSIF